MSKRSRSFRHASLIFSTRGCMPLTRAHQTRRVSSVSMAISRRMFPRTRMVTVVRRVAPTATTAHTIDQLPPKPLRFPLLRLLALDVKLKPLQLPLQVLELGGRFLQRSGRLLGASAVASSSTVLLAIIPPNFSVRFSRARHRGSPSCARDRHQGYPTDLRCTDRLKRRQLARRAGSF